MLAYPLELFEEDSVTNMFTSIVGNVNEVIQIYCVLNMLNH